MAKPSALKKTAVKAGRKVVRPQLALFEEAPLRTGTKGRIPTSVPGKPGKPTPASAKSKVAPLKAVPKPGGKPPAAETPKLPPTAADSAPTASPKETRRATAESLAQKQREISVSEFFVKNRHLLGFDNA